MLAHAERCWVMLSMQQVLRADAACLCMFSYRYVQIHAVALKRLRRVEMHLLIGLSRKDNRQRMETPRTHGMSRRWCSMYAAHERERTRLPAQHQRTERLPGERTDALLRRARKCFIILYYIIFHFLKIILYHNIIYYNILYYNELYYIVLDMCRYML